MPHPLLGLLAFSMPGLPRLLDGVLNRQLRRRARTHLGGLHRALCDSSDSHGGFLQVALLALALVLALVLALALTLVVCKPSTPPTPGAGIGTTTARRPREHRKYFFARLTDLPC